MKNWQKFKVEKHDYTQMYQQSLTCHKSKLLSIKIWVAVALELYYFKQKIKILSHSIIALQSSLQKMDYCFNTVFITVVITYIHRKKIQPYVLKNSCLSVFHKKPVLKNVAKIIEKHILQSFFFIKLEAYNLQFY